MVSVYDWLNGLTSLAGNQSDYTGDTLGMSTNNFTGPQDVHQEVLGRHARQEEINSVRNIILEESIIASIPYLMSHIFQSNNPSSSIHKQVKCLLCSLNEDGEGPAQC